MTDYAALAAIYDRLGFSDFATHITPRLVTYAQQNEWLGRRILDLGTGTGASLNWFCEHHYLGTGIDNNAEILSIAHNRVQQHSSADVIEGDIRQTSVSGYDMTLALDVLNELSSLRDLEPVFKSAHSALNAGKLFIFDLHTTEGLFSDPGDGDSVLFEEEDLFVVERRLMDYERQIVTLNYDIFTLSGAFWEREHASRVLRAYPIQAVITLLRRSGFTVSAVLDTRLNSVEPGTSGLKRVIIVTQKQ